eukprot:TRINITY_DN10349_c1_g1_i1.p1 TRINITY_DN10349_c1_g1~~TRINITY_DN10349_c1_g1_i1.p1  ORF type:complete len:483 (+),score=97.32 TRINITY_DN10349_c1_g1_i1:107-1555(+)
MPVARRGGGAVVGVTVASVARRRVVACGHASTVNRRPLTAAKAFAAVEASSPVASASPLARKQQSRHFFGGGFHGQSGGVPKGDSEKFYNLLDISKDSDEAQIKQAYKKQAMKHHPDRGGDEATFKQISKAYEVLSNPEKKQIYDTYGEEALDQMGQGEGEASGNPFDLFSSIFGFGAGGGRRSPRGKPVTADSVYELQLSLEDLYGGTRREVVFNRDALCTSCNGKGGHDVKRCHTCRGSGMEVRIQQMGPMVQQIQQQCSTCRGKGNIIPPKSVCQTCNSRCTVKEKKTFNIDVQAGAIDGSEFRFRGQADEKPDHDAGDVVIVVREKAHKTFQRVKDTLFMTKTITLSEALCGFQFSTRFLDGEDITIWSSPGQVVRPGDMMVVQGKGMPRPHGQKPGDLIVHLDVQFPHSIPKNGQDKLRDVLGGEAVPENLPLGDVEARVASQDVKRRLAHEARQQQHQKQQQHQQQQQSQTECKQQ